MRRWIALTLLSFSSLAFSQEFRVGSKVADFTVKDSMSATFRSSAFAAPSR